MHLLYKIILFLGVSIALIGCDSPKEDETAEADTKPKYAKTIKARAILRPTKGHQARGTILFTSAGEGIKIVADLDGLTPGKHGFHIHEHGDCSALDASSAGAHFNPTHKHHGSPFDADRHVGDLGNLEADDTGHAHYELVDDVVELEGPNSVIGRAVIVHADPDDFVSQPSGNAGAKVACGVIERVR